MTIPEAILALSRSPELSILLKATVLLTLALAVVRMAGRARASVRHLILASTFAALAALPLVIAAAPGLRVDIAVTPAKPAQTVAAAPAAAVISPSTAAPVAAPGWVLPSWTDDYARALGRRRVASVGFPGLATVAAAAHSTRRSPLAGRPRSGTNAGRRMWGPRDGRCFAPRGDPSPSHLRRPTSRHTAALRCPQRGAKTISGARSFTNWSTCDAGIGRCSG